MPATFVTTARNALRAITGTSLISDIDEGVKALADDVDKKMVSWWEDTFAKRPAAGQPNRFFKATDTGQLQHDTGAVWEGIVGPGATAYTIAGTLPESTNLEPSATRASIVTVRVSQGATGSYAGARWLLNGGSLATELGMTSTTSWTLSTTFWLQPGDKLSWEKGGGVAAKPNVEVIYRLL